MVWMDNTSDTKRLAEVVENIATTITEIIELKIRGSAEAVKAGESACSGMNGSRQQRDGWARLSGLRMRKQINGPPQKLVSSGSARFQAHTFGEATLMKTKSQAAILGTAFGIESFL